jgi:protoporphyrinogen oxidase
MSGLGAAHYLHAHTNGCTIRVIEARDVPGGRVRTLEEGAFAGMEIGAGWIHEYRGNPMLAVADANGIYTKVCNLSTNIWHYSDGT